MYLKPHHPVSAKRAVIIHLFDRVSPHFREDDHIGMNTGKEHLFAFFEANGYQKQFVIDMLSHCEAKRKKKTEEVAVQSEQRVTVVLPYVRGLTEQVRRVMAPIGVRVTYVQ